MNPNIPEKCNGCGAPLLLENLYVDDGCPCNTPRGVNLAPMPCAICKVENCVKPGHRLTEIWGAPVANYANLDTLSAERALAIAATKAAETYGRPPYAHIWNEFEPGRFICQECGIVGDANLDGKPVEDAVRPCLKHDWKSTGEQLLTLTLTMEGRSARQTIRVPSQASMEDLRAMCGLDAEVEFVGTVSERLWQERVVRFAVVLLLQQLNQQISENINAKTAVQMCREGHCRKCGQSTMKKVALEAFVFHSVKVVQAYAGQKDRWDFYKCENPLCDNEAACGKETVKAP